jgi:hypothetical protein
MEGLFGMIIGPLDLFVRSGWTHFQDFIIGLVFNALHGTLAKKRKTI